MTLYIYAQFRENITNGFKEFEQTENFQRVKIPYKIKMDLWFLVSVHCLIALYICTNLRDNISKGFKLLSRHDFHSDIFKGTYLRKNVGGVMVHVLYTKSDNALYLYQGS